MTTQHLTVTLALASLVMAPVLRAQNENGAPAPGRYENANEQPSAPAADGARDRLEMQALRALAIKQMGETAYHPDKFDLSGLPHYSPEQSVSGKLRIWGLNYIGDCGLNKDWEAGFRKYQPDVSFEWNLPTALIGIPGLVCGLADIAASRPITRDEVLTFQRIFNSDPVAIKMVMGSYDVPGYAESLVVAVNKANPITGLNLKQLDGIFGSQRTGGTQGNTWVPEAARGPEDNIRTWGQAGLTGEWADKPINGYVFALSEYHFARVFEQIVFHGGFKWAENMREYSNYKGSSGKIVLQDAQILADLDKDPYGIALTTYSRHLTAKTKPVPIATKVGGRYVGISLQSVQDGTYPLTFNEWWYFQRAPGHPIDPKIREFMRYVLSREGQEAVNRTGKFNPLTAEVVREELRKL